MTPQRRGTADARILGRRRFLAALAAAPVLAVVAQGCGGDDEQDADDADGAGGADDGPSEGEQRSSLARMVADASGAPVAADAVNRFGLDLFRSLAASRPTDDLVISPVSLALAMSMASVGASGGTLDEMVAVLHADDIDLHPAMNALSTALDDRDRAGVALSIANGTWLQAGMTIGPAFLDTLAAQYGSGVATVDFAGGSGGGAAQATDDINTWVAERTDDRITQLIAPDTLDEATRFVLVNAVFLDADWAVPFAPEATRDAPFRTAAGETIDVPTMSREAELAYASGDGWQAVELPYAGDELAMLLFLPEPDFLETFEQIFLVTDATRYLEPRLVRVLLPRWDSASTFGLADQLAELGMPTAFSPAADFTAITTDVPLLIAHVIHRANITVGEEGTVAAAATAVVGEATSLPPEDPIVLTFDRPFVYALRDRATGAIVFLGRVADPRA